MNTVVMPWNTFFISLHIKVITKRKLIENLLDLTIIVFFIIIIVRYHIL